MNNILLNPEMNFKTFKVKSYNEYAYEVAKEFCNGLHSKVIMTSNPGLGKTHLINSIGNEFAKRNKKYIYIDCRELIDEIIKHFKTDSLKLIEKKFNNFDYILIDNGYFLKSKSFTIKLLLDLIMEIERRDKRIFLISDNAIIQQAGKNWTIVSI